MKLKEEENSDYISKVQENEYVPLNINTNEIIDNINSKIKKISEDKYKKYLKILVIGLFFLLIIIIIGVCLLIFNYSKKNYDLKVYQKYNNTKNTILQKNITNNIDSIKNINETNKNKIDNTNKIKYMNETKNINNINSNLINTNKISVVNKSDNNITKKKKNLTIGILYSIIFGNGIARFMIVTGEYFIRKGYDVYFLTKPPFKEDFEYNKKIKRVYAYNNSTLLADFLKSGILDILIINNNFSKDNIKWFQSFGVKVIGMFHGVYISSFFNNSTGLYSSWKNTEFMDAYIHIGIDDYYFFKSFGFKRNIFIPNLYTFEPSETESSNLTNHNIMMLGRLVDKKKGLIYAIKAMSLIVKEIPDAKLNLVSSDTISQDFKNLANKLNLTNNIIYTPYTSKISEHFLNSSIFFFTSLTEAFPMALNEAKAYGLPCVTFDVSYSVPYQSGVIKVEMFDYEALAREAIKLLKDYDYRLKMGREAKLSLNRFNNNATADLWGRLFHALITSEDEFQKLREEIEKKYYNEKEAEEHMEKQLNYLKKYNKLFSCYSLKNLKSLEYNNNLKFCENVTRSR